MEFHAFHPTPTDYVHFTAHYMVANHFDSSDSSDSDDSDDSDDAGHDDSVTSENLFGSDDSDHSGSHYDSDSGSDDDMSASELLDATVPSAEDQLSHWPAWVRMRREIETERARLFAATAQPGESLSELPPRISPSGEQLLDDFLLRIADAVQSLLDGAEDSDREGDGGDDTEPISPTFARSPRPIIEDQDTDDEELTNHDLIRSTTGSIMDNDQDDDAAPLLSPEANRLDSVYESDDLEVGSLSDRSDDDRRHVRVSGCTWIPANGRFSAEYRNAAQQRAREQGYPTVSEVPDGGPVALCIRETHVDLFLVESLQDDEAAAGDSDDDQGSLDGGSYQTAELEQEIDDDWREDRLALAEIGYTTREVSSLGLAVRVALSGLGCGVLFLALYLGFCCIVRGLEKLGIWALVSGPPAQCGLLAVLLVVIL
ncbi:hypothetical protein KJ359_000396 [Pestalotiopsis sp. 9143b]|nr:hypothetical protein KJ359_000396 [Pestalotiopsis sp. 9143b]